MPSFMLWVRHLIFSSILILSSSSNAVLLNLDHTMISMCLISSYLHIFISSLYPLLFSFYPPLFCSCPPSSTLSSSSWILKPSRSCLAQSSLPPSRGWASRWEIFLNVNVEELFLFLNIWHEDHLFNLISKSTFRKTPAPSALTVLQMFNSCPANTSMSSLLQTYHCKHKTRQDVENPQVLLYNGPFSSVHLLQGFLWWLCYTTRGLPNVQALYSSCESPGKLSYLFSSFFECGSLTPW